MPSFTALAVLFTDCQKLAYVKQQNVALPFRRFKCMELTHLSRDQLQETAEYDARQAVPRPFHHVHLDSE